MSNGKNVRSLSDKFISEWNNSEIKDFYEAHKDELFIGIRDNYINLYYKCASISKIEYQPKFKKFSFEIANKYLERNNKSGRQKITFEELKSRYDSIKDNIDKIQTKEKISQQILAQNINKNNNSKWRIIDIEYVKAEQEGRFDIIAITKENPYKVALIELKYGSNAIGGDSGIRKHAEDFLSFIDENRFQKYLKAEICSIVNDYRKLASSPLPQIAEENICDKPDIYFVILANNKNNDLVEMTKRYLFDDAKRASKNNFEKKVRDKKYEEKLKNFNPIFLFSESCLMNNNNQLDIKDFTDFDRYKIEKKSNGSSDLKKF